MPKTLAGAVAGLLFLVAFNVYRQAGWDGLRSWAKSIFINKPDEPPKRLTRGKPA